ncbi:MAG: phosphatidate cytidylyltransferase [Planctomycetota bacterium]
MQKRLLFGFVLVLLVAAVVLAEEGLEGERVAGVTLPAGVFVLPVMVALAALAARELALLFRAKGADISSGLLSVSAAAGVMASTPVATDPVVSTLAGVMAVGPVVLHGLRRRSSGVLVAVGASLFAFAYAGLLFGFLLRIRLEHSIWVLVLVLAVVKSCDIFAYFTGRLVGRTPLIGWLSPGKTREGLAGGLVGSAVVGGVGAVLVLGDRSAGVVDGPAAWAIAGAAVGAMLGGLGQLGDLAASMLKRDAGVKDAGRALPGFGGVLDMLDSPIFVAPVAYWLLSLPG